LIKSRKDWEDGMVRLDASPVPDALQYRDWIGELLTSINDIKITDNNLAPMAATAAALPFLTSAWDAFDKESGRNDEKKWHEPAHSLRRTIDLLTSPARPPQDDTDVLAMLVAFTEATRGVFGKQFNADDETTGYIAAYQTPPSPLLPPSSSYLLESNLRPLEDQCRDLMNTVRVLGRQTAEQGWGEWFSEKCVRGFASIPTVCRTLIQSAGGHFVGHALGTSFGANILVPWTAAFIDFPSYFTRQLLLYRLKECCEQRVRRGNPVIDALDQSIDEIDWAAFRYALKVTPFGILITIYTAAKTISQYTGFTRSDCSNNAERLIDLADANQLGSEPALAQVVILALAGSGGEFVKIMTARKKDAVQMLAKKMEA
jgi:hypothetical protein